MRSMSRNPITFEWVECSLNPLRWHPHELGDLIQWYEEQLREFLSVSSYGGRRV